MKRVPYLLAMMMMATVAVSAQTDKLPICKGKYKPTDESLKTYQYPEWFRDAKFGIWSHWGPQSIATHNGDWKEYDMNIMSSYARGMYQHDSYDCEKGEYQKASPYYSYHLKNYGHPSKFGFKDIIPLWKAERWNPEELMKLYKRVGARYFVSMGVHQDNFYLWNTKFSRWNAVNMGPKKDVVALWQAAAKKEGLYFGVSEHLGASYTWYQAAHQADQLGDMAGVPYDGNDPEYWDLYHKPAKPGDNAWLTNDPENQREWYERIIELIDNYQPDLLYSDSPMPFGDIGRSMIAHYYNRAAAMKGNKGVVYTCKQVSDGRWVNDFERGAATDIQKEPWQTDTSIGDWFYHTDQKYISGNEVVQMLIDIVSKNGNLLLNVVQTPAGDLEQEVIDILEYIAAWMADNSEAIYGTRPWKVYGEGPSVTDEPMKGWWQGTKDVRDYQQGDFRFTMKGKTVYAFCMEKPEGSTLAIKSLGLKALTGKKVKSVKMLGSTHKITWTQNDNALSITLPDKLPAYNTLVFAIQ